MRLLNSLTNKTEDIQPIKEGSLSIYTCGPTVYESAHIGNLMSFISADTLARVARTNGLDVDHVMNITDVDDKTIKASDCKQCPDGDHNGWLKGYTAKIASTFIDHLQQLGVDKDYYKIILATDHISDMVQLIAQLEEAGIAYAADDGIYFSISKYKESGKKYGQLVNITAESTGAARIENDEYDKDEVHDFALWKKKKAGEPCWEYKSSKTEMIGRPGWHIECSAMSAATLKLPFDIHTGGIDLKFPHHENEIAQSTALTDQPMANYFVHNEFVMVDGQKMSKSKGNYYTLESVVAKGYDPLVFRMFVLRSKYNTQSNFTWKAMDEAKKQLLSLQNLAALRFQRSSHDNRIDFDSLKKALIEEASNDLNTPGVLSIVAKLQDQASSGINHGQIDQFIALLQLLDDLLGLNLLLVKDITVRQKELLQQRLSHKKASEYDKSDQLRDRLKLEGVELNDTVEQSIWYRT